MLEKVKTFISTRFYASSIDVFLLGMSMSVCGTCFAWTFAMRTHYYEYLAGMSIVTVMYICLVLCVAEMLSALPFSGGIYGLARVALSPYIGFLVGILETFKNIFHISCCVQPMALYVGNMLNDNLDNQPFYWLLILGSVTIITIIGGRFFWNFNRILGLACLAFTIMYLCTPIMNKTDFKFYGNTTMFFQPVHKFDKVDMFRYSPLAIWFYIGIELIPFTCIDVKNPTKVVPYSMIAILAVLMIFSFGAYTAACSQFPGASRLRYFDLPLMFGYADMLGMTYEHACWFSIVCIYASVFAFMFGCGRQISSLSESGLLPPFLKWKTTYRDTPYMSILTTAILCFLTMVVLKYRLNDNVNLLFYICVFSAFTSYISVFVTYIQFKTKYLSLKREFTNPFGIYAAILGICISLFMICLLLALAQNHDFSSAPITLSIVLVLASIYYFSFASKKQYYSEEEQKAFLITYVINSNNRGRKKIAKKPSNIIEQGYCSRMLSMVYFTMNTERSMSSTARKYLSMLTFTSNTSKSSIEVKRILLSDDASIHSNDPESNIGSTILGDEQVQQQPEDGVINNPPLSAKNNKSEKSDKQVKKHTNATHKLSIDFTNLPSLDVLKHMRDEIEIEEHPDDVQSIKTKEAEWDYLPNAGGYAKNKVVPFVDESNHVNAHVAQKDDMILEDIP